MLVCRFHAHKGAKTYCPQCRLFLCESCGKPGTQCKLCNKARLVDPSRAPQEATEVRACALHPQVLKGLKTCQDCGKPHCPACMKFGGLCVTCTRKENAAREALPRPELAEPAVAKKRRNQKELSVAQKFRKDRKRTVTRWAIAGVVLAGIGGLIYFDYVKFKEFAANGVKLHHKATATLPDQAGGGAQGNYEALVSRLESGEVTDAEVAETEALMAKIESGQAIDSNSQMAAKQLMALAQDPQKAARLKAQSEQSKKLWAQLSAWSSEEGEAETVVTAQEPQRAIAPPRPKRVAPPPAPKPMTVALGGLRSGQRVRGVAVVNARMGGEGMLDHVELLVNGQWQGLSNQAPYRFEWDTSGNPNGPVTVQVVAFDVNGRKVASKPVKVTIQN